ncbi:MAG TPA: hypothetical protein VL360_00150 [Gammaproteobacteria bacterium]|jgi:hypothetical protein|nr:hypothetical protein [Gammaproteobacteria bacterium]
MQVRTAIAQTLDHERKKSFLHIFSAANVAASALNLAGYLFMAGNEALVPLLMEVGRFIFFPFAALTSGLYAVFSWYQYYLERQNYSLLKAILDSIGAVAIIGAVVGYLAFTAVFTLAAPIVFAVFLGLKTLFQAGSAIYFAYKAATATDHLKKNEYHHKVKHAALSAIAGTLTTVALIGVEIIAKPFLSIFGILAGAFAAACAVVRIIDHIIKLKGNKRLRNISSDINNDDTPSSEAVMMRRFEAESLADAYSGTASEEIPLEVISPDNAIPRTLSRSEYPEEVHTREDDVIEENQPRNIFFKVEKGKSDVEAASSEAEEVVLRNSN